MHEEKKKMSFVFIENSIKSFNCRFMISDLVKLCVQIISFLTCQFCKIKYDVILSGKVSSKKNPDFFLLPKKQI